MDKIKKVNWTKTGKEFYEDKQEQILSAMDSMDWKEFKEGLSVAMSPGMAIKEIIKQMRFRKVSHFAISHHLAPYGFYGLSIHYKNADVKAYFADTGTEIISICQEVEYK